jgi:hypothetical protein
MLVEDNKYFLTGYDKGIMVVRKAYHPLLVYFGKKELSYWITMPPTTNKELAETFKTWFHTDFLQIVSHIVKKRAIPLDIGQRQPSTAGGKYGWYIPFGVMLELQKMWADENVPILMELLRPSDLIYGKGWTKRDIVNVIEEYLSINGIKTK